MCELEVVSVEEHNQLAHDVLPDESEAWRAQQRVPDLAQCCDALGDVCPLSFLNVCPAAELLRGLMLLMQLFRCPLAVRRKVHRRLGLPGHKFVAVLCQPVKKLSSTATPRDDATRQIPPRLVRDGKAKAGQQVVVFLHPRTDKGARDLTGWVVSRLSEHQLRRRRVRLRRGVEARSEGAVGRLLWTRRLPRKLCCWCRGRG